MWRIRFVFLDNLMEKITLTLLKTSLQVGVFVHKVQLAKINTINLKFQISKQSKIEIHKETNTNTNLKKRKKKLWRNGENGRRRDTYWKNELVFLPWLSPICFFLIEIWFEGVDLVQIDIIEKEREETRRNSLSLSLSLSLSHLIVIFNQTHC